MPSGRCSYAILLITIIAGGLHLWLWIMRRQGDQLKFDSRDMMRDNGTFVSQSGAGQHVLVHSLGCTDLDALRSDLFALLIPGWLRRFSSTTTRSGSSYFWVILLWKGFHFYWVHRFLHWPPITVLPMLYIIGINTGPWSGLSMARWKPCPICRVSLIIWLFHQSGAFTFPYLCADIKLCTCAFGIDALLVRDKRQLELGGLSPIAPSLL